MENSALIVVDMLYDFIDGSLACTNGENAVTKCVDFINNLSFGVSKTSESDEDILDTYPIIFIRDFHPITHCSFKENGGIWPNHCVEGTHGSEIHKDLQPYVKEELVFYKGRDPQKEQYSGFEGKNEAGQSLLEVLELMDIENIYLCGIATEYCVKNTLLDLKANGFRLKLISDALAYIDIEGHNQTLKELKEQNIQII